MLKLKFYCRTARDVPKFIRVNSLFRYQIYNNVYTVQATANQLPFIKLSSIVLPDPSTNTDKIIILNWQTSSLNSSLQNNIYKSFYLYTAAISIPNDAGFTLI